MHAKGLTSSPTHAEAQRFKVSLGIYGSVACVLCEAPMYIFPGRGAAGRMQKGLEINPQPQNPKP